MGFFILLILVLAGSILAYNASVALCMSRAVSRAEKGRIAGVLKGAEPVYLQGNTGTAALLIHGYIGSPTDYGRLPALLHEKGLTVSVPLLPGHGRVDPREFARTTEQVLIDFVKEEYRKLRRTHRKVILGGFSMGGALSVIAAAAEKPDALLLLAPYFDVKQQWYYFMPLDWYYKLAPVVPYVYRLSCFKQIRNRGAVGSLVDYDYISIKGSRAVLGVNRTARRLFEALKAFPVLIIASRHDKAVSYRDIETLACGAEDNVRFRTVENSNHMILWDYDRELVEREILRFITDTGFIEGP